ncbi:MAG: hypothetical protein A2010_13650 [Nitrospirae bacterium GWD2_57_9]|nr:MAG: hypothetical protein A2010_13650 [Nitrospirae bacterium GWD2_57_9]OGW49312.1 MAG: hypothetical protein A2078_11155 [Nitrospirae bacterium GWC2_57_9]
MRSVFLLWHTHDLPDGGEDAKLLGVYSSRHLAEKKIEEKYRNLAALEGDGDFVIDEYEVDQDNWEDDSFVAAPAGGNA